MLDLDGMISLYDELEQRQQEEAPVSLAVRLTQTSIYQGVAALPCPDCYAPARKQSVAPSDPRCRGVGYIIPADGPDPEQGGYLPVAPFVCWVRPGGIRSQWTPGGIFQIETQDTIYWRPDLTDGLQPKQLDVLIVGLPGQGPPRRYLLGEVVTAKTVGTRAAVYCSALTLQRADNIIYTIPLPDDTGSPPGTWE